MSKKANDIVRFGLLCAIVLLLNFVGNRFFFRADLTEDKRFTINPATIKLLENLEDQVYIEVYLEGDFPAGFKRLQATIKETLEEFRLYAGSRVQFAFVDPTEGRSKKERNEFYQQLAQDGLQPTNLLATEDGERSEKIIFPGAIIRHQDKQIPVMLLKGEGQGSPEEKLNRSVENVEYELAQGIQRAIMKERPSIAYITNHGELSRMEAFDLISSLRGSYKVDMVDLDKKVNLLPYDVVLIAAPDSTFSEPDKFKLDQFLLRGGNLLMFLNTTQIQLEQIGDSGTVAVPLDFNLTDLLFSYGFRVNRDLVQDLYCGFIPMVTGYVGTEIQTQPMPWPYFPVINNFKSEHPITKNLDAVKTTFISSIDTVKATGIKRTALFYTSKNARKKITPSMVNFNEVRKGLEPAMFKSGNIPLAYLAEGKFTSLYKNRLAPMTQEKFDFIEQAERPGKILLMADGDFVGNELNSRSKEPYPMGYDRFARFTFANKEFILNAISYMLDGDGIILARTKEIKLRPLDKEAIEDNRIALQTLNLALPPAFIILFGIGKFFYRRYRFQTKTKTKQ